MTNQIKRRTDEPMEPRGIFVAFVKYRRRQKGYRQEDLARIIQVRHVSELEHGRIADPHEKTLQALAQYLEVDKNLLHCLLGRWPFPKPDALDAPTLEKYLQALMETTGYSKELLGEFIIAHFLAS